MASNSKSTNLDGANSYIRRCVLTAEFNEKGTSVENNTSTIWVKASLYTPSASWDNGSGRNDNLYIYWHDNRENYDRHVATWSGSAVWAGSTISAEGTITVTHKDDGTLSGYAYAYWSRDGGNTNYAPASGGVSTDWTGLTTIARASQPSINTYPTNSPDFDIGDTITIHMNRKSNSFTHTVTFNYGNTSVQVATGVANSCTFDTSTIANDLYALIPNDNVYSSTISVKTYNGSTLIGTKTCAYNAHVVNSDPIFPDTTASGVWLYDTGTNLLGNYQFVQNVSNVKCQMLVSKKPQAQNGATITKISCSFAGLFGEKNAEDFPTSGNIDIILGTPTVYGLKTALMTAFDSRGNSTTIPIQPYSNMGVPADNQYICPYSNPSIVASCERQSNFENNTTISISGAMSSLKLYGSTSEKNAVNSTNGIQYRYKESTSSTWGSWANVASTTAGDGSVSTTDFVVSLDNQKAWDFEFKIIDKITSTTITRHVGQGQPQFFIGADGRTSVGGVPQIAMPTGKLGQLEVNGNAYANGNRLAELPITHDMLGSQCVKSDNIDFATLTGQGSLGTLVETTFWFGAPGWNYGSALKYDCVSNAGTHLKFGLINNGSGCILYQGGEKVIRLEEDCGYKMTGYISSEFGIQGIMPSQNTWTRLVGQLSGNNKNEQRSFAPDGTSEDIPGAGYGTAINDVGSRFSYGWNYVAIPRTYDKSDAVWDLMGMVGCAGVNTSVKFEIQCFVANSSMVPALYQRGLQTPSYWWHKVTIWELVSTFAP